MTFTLFVCIVVASVLAVYWGVQATRLGWINERLKWLARKQCGVCEHYRELDSIPPRGGSGVLPKTDSLSKIREALRDCRVYEDDVGWMAQHIADKVFGQEVKVGGTDE